MHRTNDRPSSESHYWFAAPSHPEASVRQASAVQQTRVFDISDIIGLVRRSRKIILLSVAATTLLALGYGLQSAKKYTAEAELYIDSRGYRVLTNDVRPMTDGNQSLAAEYETELKILTSGKVLARVVEKEKLVSNSEFNPRPGLIGILLSFVKPAQKGKSDPALAARRQLARMVKITRSDRSFVAGIQVTSKNKQLSARLAQSIANTYLEQYVSNRRDLTGRLAREVAGRLQDLREKVGAAEKRLAAYQRDNNLITTAGVLVSDQDLTELNKQLNEARTRAARAKAQLDQIRNLPRNLGASGQTQIILNSPTLVQLQVRLSDARRQLAELQRSLGNQHPAIKAAQARVASTIGAVRLEIQRQRKAIANEYEQARFHERSFQSRINKLKRNNSQISETLIGARELKRAVDANRKVYEEFLVRARELTEQQSIAPSSSRVITAATPPAKPDNIPLSILLIAGILAGLPIGLGLAFLREMIATTATGPNQGGGSDGRGSAENNDQQSVPAYQSANENQQSPDSARPAAQANSQLDPDADSLSNSETGIFEGRGGRRTHALFQSTLPGSVISEYIGRSGLRRVTVPSYELLDLSILLHKSLGETEPNVTIVFDYGDEDNSASFAAAFSSCLAYQGYDVLVADGDVKHARMTRQLNLRPSPGLYDQFHKDAENLVMWSKAGLPHILGSISPKKRMMPQGARRYLAERIDDLAGSVEYLIIYAGNLAANPYATVLIETANQAIAVGAGDARQSRNADQQLQLLADYNVPVIACIDTQDTSQDEHSASAVNHAAVVGA